jgi:hypothetical protein
MRWYEIITLPLEVFLSLLVWALDRLQQWPRKH